MLLFVDGEIYRGVGSVAWCGYFAVHTWLVTPLDLILLDILPALTRIGIEQHFNVELISDISKFFMTVSHHIRLHHDVISIWGSPSLAVRLRAPTPLLFQFGRLPMEPWILSSQWWSGSHVERNKERKRQPPRDRTHWDPFQCPIEMVLTAGPISSKETATHCRLTRRAQFQSSGYTVVGKTVPLFIYGFYT